MAVTKIVVVLVAVLTSALFFACEEPELMQGFRIRAGEHYCAGRPVGSLQSEVLKFDAMFDESAIYNLGDLALQSNKNKLFGFADCNSTHQENSARFAWQWFNDQLEIWAYCYNNGIRMEKFVGTVDIGTINQYRIEMTADSYRFYLNDALPVELERTAKCTKGMYYLLWPYFGGSVPAPHDITIRIRRY